VLRLLLAFGVVFELPVVVAILSSLGVVTPSFLRKKRRHAIVLITILASFLSPGDVVSVTILLMVPLVVLYEVSIVASSVIHRRRLAGEDIDGSADTVPLLFVLGVATARWRNRLRTTVATEGT
jgi:sec-independent protein translocase protein TatC